MAGEDSLSSASALVGSVRQLMTFVGPLLGAFMLRFASPATAFAVNGVCFALSAFVLLFVPRLSEPRVASTDDLFVVQEGDFAIFDADRQINNMSSGDWFGEIGLLQRSPRTATVVATSQALVWRIPGETFLSALGHIGRCSECVLDTMADRLARSANRAS